MTAKQFVSHFKGDKYIWMIVILLSLGSILAVYSAIGTLAYKTKAGNTEFYLFKHLALMGLAFGMMFIAHKIDYKHYSKLAQIFLLASFPLLLYTLVFGDAINSANRWLTIPVIKLTFQTSDFAKLALMMYLARYLTKYQEVIHDFRSGFMPAFLTVLGICVLIAPADLSTAAVIFGTSMLIMFIGRVKLGHIAATSGAMLGVVIIFGSVLYAMPDEQLAGKGRMLTWKNRVVDFFESGEDGFQVVQAKIAVAGGGLFGKGPGNSTQRNVLPHPYSDFIFAIILEEYGFIGGMMLIVIYLVLLYRTIRIAVKSPGTFGALLAVGLSLSLVIQAFMNMGVAVSLFPVTGLALPFVSMGGTSQFFTAIALGIVLSVSSHIEKGEEKLAKDLAAELEDKQPLKTAKKKVASASL